MTVREFLTHNGLSAYADAFEAQQVGLDGLGHLSDDDLRADFGMGPYLDRKRFKAAVAGLTGASMFGEAAPLSGATRFEAPTPAPLSGATRFEAPTPAPLSGATRFEPVGPTRVDAPSALPERLGSYRVLGLLGVGGMGTVVRARHTEEGWAQRQGGDVAIKLIHPQIASDATFRDRFFSEAELGRRVQHPGLVPTFDVIAEGVWLGTVMSLVVGEPLTTKVVPGGLPVSQVVTLLQPVAEALDYLHGQGIVHRDLKPANIMVRADGRPVVLDLGIAKDTQALENHTRTMTAMGTSAWMAPEQADAKHVDGAADRYALGMIAYALLAGRLPWEEGTSEARVLAAKIYGKLSSLEQVRSGLPGHVTAAVMKMVSVDAGVRYATCAAFVGALRVDDGAAARAAAEAAELKAKAAAKLESELEAEARMKDAAEASAKLKAAAENAIPAAAAPAPFAAAAVAPAAASDNGASGMKLGLAVLGVLGLVGGLFWMFNGESGDGSEPSAPASASASDFQSPTLGTMKWIPAGTFTMGSATSESGRFDDETQHSVTLTKGCWLMEHEVTQGEWQSVMGSNPSNFKACGPTCPVEQVSWDDAVAFAQKASARDGVEYTLPTEAEWEYAARGGLMGELYAGSDEATSVGWIDANSGNITHTVCGKARNGYGLCDMTGNVWEWTSDGYGDYGGSATDPTGASNSSYRVNRGGGWGSYAQSARVAYRFRYEPTNRGDYLGFRLSRTGT